MADLLDTLEQLLNKEETDSLEPLSGLAEYWAQHVVKQGGECYAYGDEPFWREAVHRAGGLAMMRLLTPEVVLDKNDLIFFQWDQEDGWENRYNHMGPHLAEGAQIFLFGREEGLDELEQRTWILQGQYYKILTEKGLSSYARKMNHILNLWVLTAEFISACTRLGVMPNILVSITHPKGYSLNGNCFYSRFWQGNVIRPVEEGVLGSLYLAECKKILAQLKSQQELFAKASEWIHKVHQDGGEIKESVAGHWASYLPRDTQTPEWFNSDKQLKKGDIRIMLDYNYYPEDEVDKLLNQGIKVILMLTSREDEGHFKGLIPSALGQPMKTWKDIPQHENLLLLDGYWPWFDGCLLLPDYPYPFCPLSWFSHGAVHGLLTENLK
jgi:hypothetical protein